MNATVGSRILRCTYGVSVFVSAFLLFQVQPLIGKFVLPWFGGTPSVWTTCMLFFQVALFGGYAYAHFLAGRKPVVQAIVHLGLLCAALLLLPIQPSVDWKPTATDHPTTHILLLLGACVGAPYFLLAATGPLLQNWFSRTCPGRSPYRLYALSNTGSLLALLSYPFYFEPVFSTGQQSLLWSWGFVAFALGCTICATWQATLRTRCDATEDAPAASAAPPSWQARTLWFGLAATASVMLLATTNQLCLDVAAVPFLWVLPLTLYLLSFILCFDSDRWYRGKWWGGALLVCIPATIVMMQSSAGASLLMQVAVYAIALFVACMVCHGELAQRRPAPERLTEYYLTLAAGGAAGGLLVGIVCPRLFPTYLEMHCGLLMVGGCAVYCFFQYVSHDDPWRSLRRGGLALGFLWLAIVLGTDAVGIWQDASHMSRNFYGVLRVQEAETPFGPERILVHGRIVHGRQFLDPDKRHWATAYYHETSGIGQLFEATQDRHPQRVGVIGLGVGTLAKYGRAGDTFRFYEINSDVIRLAEHYFHYLEESPATVEMVVGDARLMMEQEPLQDYDVLVVDAFSGDAIPTHLLTREAFRVYLRQLSPGGAIAIHYSNRHFDLEPVLRGLAEDAGLFVTFVKSLAQPRRGVRSAHWALLSSDRGCLPVWKETMADAPCLLWTDDRCDLWSVLKSAK